MVGIAAAAMSVEAAGETLHLLPHKAIWWATQRTLLVADAHIGKAVTFRKLGVLPAFAAFTGMHPIEPGDGDRVYAIADDRVVALRVAAR